MSDSLHTQLKKEIDSIRPYFQEDGGDLNFISFDDKTGIITVEINDTCGMCAAQAAHLEFGVLEELKAKYKQVKGLTINGDPSKIFE